MIILQCFSLLPTNIFDSLSGYVLRPLAKGDNFPQIGDSSVSMIDNWWTDHAFKGISKIYIFICQQLYKKVEDNMWRDNQLSQAQLGRE